MRPKTPQDYEKLKAELKAPFLGVRRFVYLACGASGSVGAYIFLTQLLAQKGELSTNLNNLAVQMGVIGLTILLYSIDRPKI
jgi:Low psii accumulation1 / Rep27